MAMAGATASENARLNISRNIRSFVEFFLSKLNSNKWQADRKLEEETLCLKSLQISNQKVIDAWMHARMQDRFLLISLHNGTSGFLK